MVAHELERFREKLDRELKSGLVSLLLLLVIARTGPAYGYQILRTIETATGGRLAFREGTAYPLLSKLEAMDLVTSYWGAGSGGPPRRYYQVTDLGREALDHALRDWRALTDAVQAVVEDVEETEA